jgi:hypothetical protein
MTDPEAATPVSAPVAESELLSEPARLAAVFFSPGKAFADIARRPRWWAPVVLSMLFTTVFLYLFSQRVGWEEFFRQQNARSVQIQGLDPAARARAEMIQMQVAQYGAWVSGLAGPWILLLVVAGVLQFLANVVIGAGIAFKNMLAAVAYGGLPRLLQTALSILVMYLKPPEEFDLRNPLLMNAAVFLPADAPSWLRVVAASLDLFTFWSMLLMAIGIAAAAKRLSTGKAFAMILFPWALWVILTAGAAAAFGA